MTMTIEAPESEWPKEVAGAWHTSDGYRFRRESRAKQHQASVDDPDTDQGTHGPAQSGSTGDSEEGS